jgi:hypothetical protein
MDVIDSLLLEEQTVYRHQSTYGDGFMIEAMRTVQDAIEEENRHWRTF